MVAAEQQKRQSLSRCNGVENGRPPDAFGDLIVTIIYHQKMFIASLLAVCVFMTNEWQLKIVAFLMSFLGNQIFITSNDTINIFQLMCSFVLDANKTTELL